MGARTGLGLAWVCLLGGCQQILGIESLHPPSDATSVADASAPTAITLTLPPYLDLDATGSWRAELVGPAMAAASFSWQVTPPGAVTMAATTGNVTLGADGRATLTGTVTAGSAPSSPTLELVLTGATAGSRSGSLVVADFQVFGNRAAFPTTTDVSLMANRMFATPVAVPQGTRIIAFGMRDGSVASDVKLGLYATAGSEPGGLLLESPVFHAEPGETLQFLPSPQTLTAPAAYLAVIAATNISIPINGAAGQEVSQFTRDTPFGQPLPATFGQMASFMGGASNVFVVAIP